MKVADALNKIKLRDILDTAYLLCICLKPVKKWLCKRLDGLFAGEQLPNHISTLRALCLATPKWHMPCFKHMQEVVARLMECSGGFHTIKHLLTGGQTFHRGKDGGGHYEQNEKDQHGS
jgi:hypothetical protein